MRFESHARSRSRVTSVAQHVLAGISKAREGRAKSGRACYLESATQSTRERTCSHVFRRRGGRSHGVIQTNLRAENSN